MRKLFLLLLSTTLVFGQGGRPPIDKYSQLTDVNVSGLAISNIMVWDGTFWVPSSTSTGAGLPPIAAQGGKFLTTDASTIFWGLVPFASLSGKPTTALGYGIAGGANLDLWGAKTPYAGTLTITSGKTVAFPNTFSITATDGATLNIGTGGTLGANAFSSVAFVLQTTTVNGHALSGNVTVTKSDLGLGYLLSGAGSPEGAISAPVGSQYARTDGGVGTTFYVKQSGTGNTGWTAGAGGGSLPTGGTVGQVLVKNSSTDFDSSWAVDPGGTGGGSGTVLDVAVATANGVSGTVAAASTHPVITLSLGAITPSSVAATGTVTGTNLSGTNTGDQTITLTGPVTGSGTGSIATTIAGGAVGLGQIATIPANTILGNNTTTLNSPIALIPSQAKVVLGLSAVENTALSTWPGSANITTLGTVTLGLVTTAALPLGISATSVAVGNDGRFPATVVGIRKSAGAGSTDTAAVANADYALAAEGGFNNTGGPGPSPAPTPTSWGAGKTVMSENSVISGGDKYSLLPAASAYSAGTIITYVDSKTTANFGRNFRPQDNGDLLDGLPNTGTPSWTSNNAWLRPFIAGGLGGSAGGLGAGQGTYQWKTNGINAWVSIYANGRAIKIQDSTFADKQVVFDASTQPGGSTVYTFTPSNQGNSVSVFPNPDSSVPPPGGAVSGVLPNGALDYTQIVPNPTTETAGKVLTVVNPDGTSGTWVAQPVSQAISGWVDIGDNANGSTDSTTTPPTRIWNPVLAQGQQNGYWVLPASGNRQLKINTVGLQSGQTFNLLLKQASTGSGCVVTFALPDQVLTPSGGNGTIQQTLTNNATDYYEIKYVAKTTTPAFPFIVTQTALNLTAGTPILTCSAAGTEQNTGTTVASTGNILNPTTNNKYKAANFIATETSVCSVEIPLIRVGAPNYAIHAAIYTDAIRAGGTYTNNSTDGTTNVVTAPAATTWSGNDQGQRVTVSAGFPAGRLYIATVPDSTHITISSDKAGTIAVNSNSVQASGVTVSIYGAPGTIVDTATGSTNTLSAFDLPTAVPSGTGTVFTGLTATGMVVNDTYHVVLWGDGTGSATDYVVWPLDPTATPGVGYSFRISSTGSTWGITSNKVRGRFKLKH